MIKPLLRTMPTMSGNVKLACTLLDYNKISNDTYETNIRGAHLYPISSQLFQKSINVSLLNSSWEYDINKFYNAYSDEFYNTIFDINRIEMPLLDKTSVLYPRNTDFEYGVKRISYKKSGCQYACFAPIYIDNVNDIPNKFVLDVHFQSDNKSTVKHIVVNIGSNKESKYNYIYKYLSKYLSKIDDDVAYMDNVGKTVTYYGIDVVNGGFTKKIDSSVSSLFNIQMPIQMFDETLTIGFSRNRLAIRQIIPLCFYFNLSDILNQHESNIFEFNNVTFSGAYYDKNDKILDWYDFDWDYDNYKSDILVMNSLTGALVQRPGYVDNIVNNSFPSFNEKYITKYQFSNKLDATFGRWKLKYSDDSYPYITNMSWSFSNNQNSNFKYREFPAAYLNQSGFATINRYNKYNLSFPYGSGKKEYDRINPRSAKKYKAIMDNYCVNWFDTVNDNVFDGNILDINKVEWYDVNKGYSFVNSVLYNLNVIYDRIQNIKEEDKIDKFAVLLYPNTSSIKSEEEIKKNIKFVKYNITRSHISSVSGANCNFDAIPFNDGQTKNYGIYDIFKEDKKDSIEIDNTFETIGTLSEYLEKIESLPDDIYINAKDAGIDYYKLNKVFQKKLYKFGSNNEYSLDSFVVIKNDDTITEIQNKKKDFYKLIDVTIGINNDKVIDTDIIKEDGKTLDLKPIELDRIKEILVQIFKDFNTKYISYGIIEDIVIFYIKVKEAIWLQYYKDHFDYISSKENDNEELKYKYTPKLFYEYAGKKLYEFIPLYISYMYQTTGDNNFTINVNSDNKNVCYYDSSAGNNTPNFLGKDIENNTNPLSQQDLIGKPYGYMLFNDYGGGENQFIDAIYYKNLDKINMRIVEQFCLTYPGNYNINDLFKTKSATYKLYLGIDALYEYIKLKLSDDIFNFIQENTDEMFIYSPKLQYLNNNIFGEYITKYNEYDDAIEDKMYADSLDNTDNNVIFVHPYNFKYLKGKIEDTLGLNLDSKILYTAEKYGKVLNVKHFKTLYSLKTDDIWCPEGKTVTKDRFYEQRKVVEYSEDTETGKGTISVKYKYSKIDLSDHKKYVNLIMSLEYDPIRDMFYYNNESVIKDNRLYFNIVEKLDYIKVDQDIWEYSNISKDVINKDEYKDMYKDLFVYRPISNLEYDEKYSNSKVYNSKDISILNNKEFTYRIYPELIIDSFKQINDESYNLYLEYNDTDSKQTHIKHIGEFGYKENVKFNPVVIEIINDITNNSKIEVVFESVDSFKVFKNENNELSINFTNNNPFNIKIINNIKSLGIYNIISEFIGDINFHLNWNGSNEQNITLEYGNQNTEEFNKDDKNITVKENIYGSSLNGKNDNNMFDFSVYSDNASLRNIKLDFTIKFVNTLNNTNNDDKLENKDTNSLLYPCFNDIYVQEREDTLFFDNYSLNNIQAVEVINSNNENIGTLYRYNSLNNTLFINVSKDELIKAGSKYNDIKLYSKITASSSLEFLHLENSDPLNKLYNKYNINVITGEDGTRYGFYLMNCILSNTVETFNIRGYLDTNKTLNSDTDIDQISNIKYITYIDDVDITAKENKTYVQDIFKQLCPFLYVNMVNIFSRIDTIISPAPFNLLTTYSTTLLDTTNQSKERVLQYNKQTILSSKKQVLQRYTNAIVPYIKPTIQINNLYYKKYKDTSASLIDTGKFMSIGDATITYNIANINTVTPISIYSYSEDSNVKSYNNIVSSYLPLEYKYYNISKMMHLVPEFTYTLNKILNYQGILENETNDIVFKIFKDIILEYNRILNNDELLFLYNKYSVEFIKTEYNNVYNANEKYYKLTYKFTLL